MTAICIAILNQRRVLRNGRFFLSAIADKVVYEKAFILITSQVSLEALGESAVIDALRRTQVDTLSPLEALNLLYEWKQKLQ